MPWQTFPQNFWVPRVEESPRVIITRFQDPLKVLWLLGHSWSSNITDFGALNKCFMSGKVRRAYIHTLIFPVYNID